MKKNVIVYGKETGIQKQAIKHLSQILLDENYEYPICISSDKVQKKKDSVIFI